MIVLPIACGITGNSLADGSSLLSPLSVSGMGLSLGPNEILNGTFDSDTIWTKGIGWTIGLGVASRAADPSSAGLSQPITFVAGARYVVTYTIIGYLAGLFVVQFTGGSTRSGTSRTADGTYTETLTANTGNTSFRIFAGSAAVASVDNITLQRVS